LGNGAQTEGNTLPTGLLCPMIQKQIHQERRGMLIMTNEIGHENINDVIIDRDRSAKARHAADLTLYF